MHLFCTVCSHTRPSHARFLNVPTDFGGASISVLQFETLRCRVCEQSVADMQHAPRQFNTTIGRQARLLETRDAQMAGAAKAWNHGLQSGSRFVCVWGSGLCLF